MTDMAMHYLGAIFIFAAYLILFGCWSAIALGVWAGYILDTAE